MKILVIGLDGAAPELLFGDESLVNFRRLMEAGCFGRLESIVPPITVPAWMCLATSQDPGSLGVYGFRNRADHSYGGLQVVNSASIRELAVWDQVGREGGRASIVGVPPGYPPRKVSGLSVGCFLTPDPARDPFTRPLTIKDDILRLVGDYPVDVKNFRTHAKAWLKDEIYTMTRKHFEVVRHLLRGTAWDYFQFVEIGLDRMQHGFWKFHDPQHRQYCPGSPYETVLRDYYRYLDDEVGRTLEELTEETAVLVVSDHGAQRLDGGFCVNEWLIREGLLVLHEYPRAVTPFSRLAVDWSRTTAWSEGGYYARVFLNVKGREPHGTIDPADYERVRDDLRARLEALPDDRGQPMGTQVFRPEEVYRSVRNVAPDLIVHFGGLYWRSIGSVGYPSLHVEENDTGPDDCNHAPFGSFILAAPGVPPLGAIDGAHLLDIAPTLLELGGYDVPPSMQGRSLLAGGAATAGALLSAEAEALVRDRLSGLGYIG
ncbi:MAG: alkaline phosphatase family protein [Gemmataceae bacterium]|nr:alkaline phosphatase family protein [Gemmataceae bacterium]